MNLIKFSNKSIELVYTTGKKIKGYAEFIPSVNNDDGGDILTLRDELSGSLYEVSEEEIESIKIIK